MSLILIAKRKCKRCADTFTYEIKHNGRTKICQKCKIKDNMYDYQYIKYMSSSERKYFQDPIYQLMRLFNTEGLTGFSNYAEYAELFNVEILQIEF